MATDEQGIGHDAQTLVDLISGRRFKVICGVLIVVGILYGLSTGELFSDRIPTAAEQVEMQQKNNPYTSKFRPGSERASKPRPASAETRRTRQR